MITDDLSRLLRRLRGKPRRSAQAAAPPAKKPSHTAVSKRQHERTWGLGPCQERAFLNIGPGGWTHPYWQNLDILQPKYKGNPPDIIHNLMTRTPIPVESQSLVGVYCSHVIEHIPNDANMVLFREMHRALREGGVFRFVFPDIDVAFAAYARNDRSLFLDNWPRSGNKKRADVPISVLFTEFFAWHRLARNLRREVPGHVTYEADAIERLIEEARAAGDVSQFYDKLTLDLAESFQAENPGCHRNWWNAAKLSRMLEEAGFRVVSRSAYLQSSFLPLRNGAFFDQTHPELSGYIEAIK